MVKGLGEALCIDSPPTPSAFFFLLMAEPRDVLDGFRLQGEQEIRGEVLVQETEVKEVIVIFCTASPPETFYCHGMACDLSKDIHPTSGWPRDPILSSNTAAENYQLGFPGKFLFCW